MGDHSVFSNNQESQPQATPAPQAESSNVFTDQLSAIKNENGEQKYGDVPKALEALAHSQQFIPQLKTDLEQAQAEAAALRAQLAETKSVEEVVSRLLPSGQEPAQPEVTPQVSGLDENAVATLINNTLQERQAQTVAAENEQLVSDTMFKLYGEKANETIAAKAQELGTTVQALQEQARRNPKLVLAAFDTQPQTIVQPITGSVTIPRGAPQSPEKLTSPEKSLLSGASISEQADFMRKIRAEVYTEHGVTE